MVENGKELLLCLLANSVCPDEMIIELYETAPSLWPIQDRPKQFKIDAGIQAEQRLFHFPSSAAQ